MLWTNADLAKDIKLPRVHTRDQFEDLLNVDGDFDALSGGSMQQPHPADFIRAISIRGD